MFVRTKIEKRKEEISAIRIFVFRCPKNIGGRRKFSAIFLSMLGVGE